MAQIDEIIAQADTYRDYCALVEEQALKAEQYVQKAAEHLTTQVSMTTAVFPYGVGPVIMGLKAQATQLTKQTEDAAEAVSAAAAYTEKLSELEMPEGGCD